MIFQSHRVKYLWFHFDSKLNWKYVTKIRTQHTAWSVEAVLASQVQPTFK